MKQVIFAALIAATSFSTAKAQLLSSESVGGTLVGGIAGGLIGGHRHRGEGIAIGAGAGFLLGSLSSSYARRYEGPYAPEYYRPTYAVSGAILGGVAGGAIGAATRHTGAGIAIGAGAGLLLGTLAEHEGRRRAALIPVHYPQPTYIVVSSPMVPQVPAVETAPATLPNAMGGANSLFGR